MWLILNNDPFVSLGNNTPWATLHFLNAGHLTVAQILLPVARDYIAWNWDLQLLLDASRTR